MFPGLTQCKKFRKASYLLGSTNLKGTRPYILSHTLIYQILDLKVAQLLVSDVLCTFPMLMLLYTESRKRLGNTDLVKSLVCKPPG